MHQRLRYGVRTTLELSLLACLFVTGCKGDPNASSDDEDGGPGSDPSTGGNASSSGNHGDGGLTPANGGSSGGNGGTSNAGSGNGNGGGSAGAPGSGTSCTDDPCDPNATCTDETNGATCECNDAFVGNGVTCESTDCEAITLEGGAIDCPNGAQFGDTCAFSCNAGFELSGGTSRICTSDRSWSGDATLCTAVDPCLAGLDDCSPNATCQAVGDSYECSCSTGFIGDGHQCESSDCGALTLQNGTIACPNGAGFGDSCTFSCDTDFELSGDSSRICTSDGSWSGTQASCTGGSTAATCDTVAGTCGSNAACAVLDGTAQCVCNDGYIGDGVTCQESGCIALTLSNGTISCPNGAQEGDTCNFSCNSGFTAAGSTSRRCQEDGNWTGTDATCTNVNECNLGDDDCDDNATCADTPGFYTCTCDEGWVGDGTSCLPDETAEEALVAHWTFNEGSGATTADEGPFGSDCAVSGATWVSNGVDGAALRFDGTNDYLSCGDDSSLNLTEELTYAAWVNIPEASDFNWTFVIYAKGTGSQLRVGIFETPSKNPVFYSATAFASDSVANLELSNWEHIAVTFNSNLSADNVRFYLNGAPTRTATISTLLPSSNVPATIGGTGVQDQWAMGVIDEVRIYDRALEPEEVSAEYNRIASAP